VNRDVAAQREGFEVELIGERRPALRLAEPAFDPKGPAHAGMMERPC